MKSFYTATGQGSGPVKVEYWEKDLDYQFRVYIGDTEVTDILSDDQLTDIYYQILESNPLSEGPY